LRHVIIPKTSHLLRASSLHPNSISRICFSDMAPTINSAELAKRYYYGYYDYNSPWYIWGRWVLAAAVVIFFIILFYACSHFNARRRRRAGLPPRYGTGWALGKTPYGHNGPQYNGGYQGQQTYGTQPYAPPYNPPVENQYTGNTFDQNQGYYGGQQTGIELQSPAPAYTQGSSYAPPQGPPPNKARYDGVIR